MFQEFRRCAPKRGPARHFPPPAWRHQAKLQKGFEGGLRQRRATDFFHIAARAGLVIGDDGECFHRRAGQAARAFHHLGQAGREVRSRPKSIAAADFRQHHAAPLIGFSECRAGHGGGNAFGQHSAQGLRRYGAVSSENHRFRNTQGQRHGGFIRRGGRYRGGGFHRRCRFSLFFHRCPLLPPGGGS